MERRYIITNMGLQEEISDYNLGERTKLEKIISTFVKSKLGKTIKNDNFYDVVISSNYSQVFKFRKNAPKVLWMHNELQIEKSLRRKEFFPIIKYKPHVIFVSDYLKKKTSFLYPFKDK